MTKARDASKKKKNVPSKRRSHKTKEALGTGAGVKKICWTQQEDARLRAVLDDFHFKPDHISWVSVATKMPGRVPKQCRLRWYNNLDPNVKRDAWTDQDKLNLFELQQRMGNKWTDIAKTMFRSEGDVKNRWNTRGFRDLRKALAASSLERMEQLIVARQSGFPVELLSASVTHSMDLPVAHSMLNVVRDNSEQKKPPADPILRETNASCKMSPAQIKNSQQNNEILPKGSFTSETETDDSLPEDDSIAGLVAQDMALVLPPLCVEPSPSWDPDASAFGKFDATTLPTASPDCPWPSSLLIFTSPMDSDFEYRINTPRSGEVSTCLQSSNHNHFAHV